MRYLKVEAYNTDDLLKKLEETDKKYTLKSVTLGPDNTPEHIMTSDIYTAWLEIE